MTRNLIDDLFFDIFGKKTFDEMFGEYEKLYSAFNKAKDNKEDENEHSYYHKVADTYEDGNHTSHIEKEVKDGEVLKDVKETYQLDNKEKECNKICCKNESKCNESVDDNKSVDSEFYENKLKEANDLLDEANKTIKIQMNTIELYKDSVDILMKRCEEYEDKLNAISKAMQ